MTKQANQWLTILVTLLLVLAVSGCRAGDDGGPTLIATAPTLDHDCEVDCESAITVFDTKGNEVRSIGFDGQIILREVNYPGRVIAIEWIGDGALRPYVVDVESGETVAIGIYDGGWAELILTGQPSAGSAWYQVFRQSPGLDGYGARLVNLETLEVTTLDELLDAPFISFSADEDLATFALRSERDEVSTVSVIDTDTMAGVEEFRLLERKIGVPWISPNGERVAISLSTEDRNTVLGVGEVEQGGRLELIELAGEALGWFDDQTLVVEVEESLHLVDSASWSLGKAQPAAFARQVRILSGQQWHVADLEESVALTNFESGAQVTARLDAPMRLAYGYPVLPSDYVWAFLGGASGSVDRLTVARLNLAGGTIEVYDSGPRDGIFVVSQLARYSNDASAAIVASRYSNSPSFYLGGGGDIEELPSAIDSAFCDDGSFVLVGQDKEGPNGPVEATKLYSEPGSDPVAEFGVHSQAVCVG